jgi:hypothetical protein
MAAGPIYIGTVKTGTFPIVNGTGTATSTVYTAGASGGKLQVLTCVSNDTAARVVGVYIQRGGAGADIELCTTTVPISAGIGAVAAVNLIAGAQFPSILEDGTIVLGPNDVVKVAVEVAVTAAKQITVFASGGDY